MASAPPRTQPPKTALPVKVSTQPNQTLYIRNLPSSKIQKADLRVALYMLFSTYGPVLDVVVLKASGMRGQAHVVYRDIHTSTMAMRALEGFEFMGKQLVIQYGRGKSHIISKLDGSFKTSTGAAAVEVTELQQSIFNAPGPGSPSGEAANLPAAPAGADAPAAAATTTTTTAEDARGQKRPRDEDGDDDDDVAMEEDSDDD